MVEISKEPTSSVTAPRETTAEPLSVSKEIASPKAVAAEVTELPRAVDKMSPTAASDKAAPFKKLIELGQTLGPVLKQPTNGRLLPFLPKAATRPQVGETLGAYLTTSGYTPADLIAGSWQLAWVAQSLLWQKGIVQPTQRQIQDTEGEMTKAFGDGTWQTYIPTAKPALLAEQDGFLQLNQNIFYENQVYPDSELTADFLTLPDLKHTVSSGYSSGRTGMMLAASFINTKARGPGDFSEAYGKPAWRNHMKAYNHLNDIPQGQFIAALTPELICKVNAWMFTADTGLDAYVLRKVAGIVRGHEAKGGEFRKTRQFTHPYTYTDEQVAHLKELGITLHELPGSRPNHRVAFLEYPPPEEVPLRVQQTIDRLKTALAAPTPDVIGAASRFERELVAIHPFEDSNGRTSRMFMDRILAEFNLPPAIFSDQNEDIDLTPDAYRHEVAQAIRRSHDFFNNWSQLDSAGYDTYLQGAGLSAGVASSQNVAIGDSRFVLGQDGFLYNPMGRPHLVIGHEVVPLGQLDYYVLARRLIMATTTAGQARLMKLTSETRDAFTKLAADPKQASEFRLLNDDRVRLADSRFELRPEYKIAELLASLARVDFMDPTQMFHLQSWSFTSTSASQVMSRYAQIDLEFWYLEQGLKAVHRRELVEKIKEQRRHLFVTAKAALDKAQDATAVSAANPQGFTKNFESIMYAASPLRFDSLPEAQEELGDDHMTVWRGDYTISRLLGMAPNNDVRQADGRTVAQELASRHIIGNYYNQLNELEGSAMGVPYISTTSDLSLLSSEFADQRETQDLNFTQLPGFLAGPLAWFFRKARVVQNFLGVPGKFIETTAVKDGVVSVSAERRAFELHLPKTALLPGLQAIGNVGFVNEQEMHGLQRVWPWQVGAAHLSDDLGKPFGTPPMVTPPLARPPTSTPMLKPGSSLHVGVPVGA